MVGYASVSNKGGVLMFRACSMAAILVYATVAPGWAGDLPVRVQSNDKSLFLSSIDGSTMRKCTVLVNSRYSKDIDSISPSGKVEVWWSELIAKTGQRMDPRLERVERVHVLCDSGDQLFKP
jgi:hypothetical protein